jgi:hypothetical protein
MKKNIDNLAWKEIDVLTVELLIGFTNFKVKHGLK